MGDDASERTATDDEIDQMQRPRARRDARRCGRVHVVTARAARRARRAGRAVELRRRPTSWSRSTRCAGRVRPGLDRVHPPHVPRRLRRRRPRPGAADGPHLGSAGAPQHVDRDAARARRVEAQSRLRGVGHCATACELHPDVRGQPAGRALHARLDVPVRRDAELPRHADACRRPNASGRLRDPAVARPDAARARRPAWSVVRVRVGGRCASSPSPGPSTNDSSIATCRPSRRRAGRRSARRLPRPLARRGPRDAVRARHAAVADPAGRGRDDDAQRRR